VRRRESRTAFFFIAGAAAAIVARERGPARARDVLDLAGRGHAHPYVRFASSATNSLHASKTSLCQIQTSIRSTK
jgi:hypothetical protein